MTLKKHQNPEGGLNEAGRKHFERKEGGNLRAPVKSGVNPRRVSFAARFSGMNAKMKDEKAAPQDTHLLSRLGALDHQNQQETLLRGIRRSPDMMMNPKMKKMQEKMKKKYAKKPSSKPKPKSKSSY